jgi:hypothetical protein
LVQVRNIGEGDGMDAELNRRILRARRRYQVVFALSAVGGGALGLVGSAYRGLDPLFWILVGLIVGSLIAAIAMAGTGRRDMDRRAVLALAGRLREQWISDHLEPRSIEIVQTAAKEAESRFVELGSWEEPLDSAATTIGREAIDQLEGRPLLVRSTRLKARLLLGVALVVLIAAQASSTAQPVACSGPVVPSGFEYRGAFEFVFDGTTWVDLTSETTSSSPCVVAALEGARSLAGAHRAALGDDLYLPNVLEWRPAAPTMIKGLGEVRSVLFPFGQWSVDGPLAAVLDASTGRYDWYRLRDDDARAVVGQLFQQVHS